MILKAAKHTDIHGSRLTFFFFVNEVALLIHETCTRQETCMLKTSRLPVNGNKTLMTVVLYSIWTHYLRTNCLLYLMHLVHHQCIRCIMQVGKNIRRGSCTALMSVETLISRREIHCAVCTIANTISVRYKTERYKITWSRSDSSLRENLWSAKRNPLKRMQISNSTSIIFDSFLCTQMCLKPIRIVILSKN